MAKGVNIPLTISGLREAREDLAKLKEEIKRLKTSRHLKNLLNNTTSYPVL